MKTETNSDAPESCAPPPCSPRYSFRLPDGALPVNNGKLSWVGNVDQALKDAESWAATHLVVLHQREDSEKWFITDEIPLENSR